MLEHAPRLVGLVHPEARPRSSVRTHPVGEQLVAVGAPGAACWSGNVTNRLEPARTHPLGNFPVKRWARIASLSAGRVG